MPTLPELLETHLPALDLSAEDVREARTGRTRPIVVLDDHPSGTQSVSAVPVVTAWSTEDLQWVLATGAPAVYVETATRALAAADTEDRDFDVTRAALAAAAELGIDVDIALRSDSTLRGHYPLETDVVANCLEADANHHVDGLIICPAFPDAGRVTIDSVHYVKGEREVYHPVHTTEFAADPAFAFETSFIPEWIEDRTGGRTSADEVVRITLADLRTGPDAVSNLLMQARRNVPIVVDAVEESDLRCLAIALYRAEARGRRFLFRVAPQFIRAYIGQDIDHPLSGSDVEALREGGRAEGAKHGLVVVGKPTGRTERQLHVLRRRLGLREVEISIPALVDHRRAMHIDEVVSRAVQGLDDEHVVLRLSREGSTGDADYLLDRRVSQALLQIIRKIIDAVPLRFVVSRGGAIATTVGRGIGMRRGWVRGSLLPGAVSLWQAETGPCAGVPCAVYAGSIGDDDALADVVDICANNPITPRHRHLAPEVLSQPSDVTAVAVIGLGATGLPIAARLAERFSVLGYDIDEERRELAWRNSVTGALSAVEAAQSADLIMVNVRDATQVNQVLFGDPGDADGGIAPVLKPGSIVVLCTTVGIEEARAVSERLAKREVHLVDAPVSGGPDRARRGELLIAAGGAKDALAAAEPILTQIAQRVVHVGSMVGDGQAMKIANQLLSAVQILGTAEALSLAGALGLDRSAVVDFLKSSDTSSYVVAERAQRMLARQAPVHTSLDVTTKDLGIVASTAYHTGVGVPMAGLAEQLFLLGQRAGLGHLDDSAIIRMSEPEDER
ncbi:MAG: four-carbon acid sugar kinase family protein [Bowdeniella nasicola]|nr:four-carbon acid sugar kinase family protein [Bowdeniella nasicola]